MEGGVTRRVHTYGYRSTPVARTGTKLAKGENETCWRTRRCGYDYSEIRQVVIGLISDRVCVCVYTIRDGRHRIISLRRANSREQARYWQAVEDRLGTRG
jgi:hypothetical protein